MIEVLQFGLSSNRGGIETYLKKIWDNIDHTHFHFNFIDMTGDGKKPCFYEELSESGCRFYKVTPRRSSVSKNREDIRKLFQENHFDIFHFNVNTLSYLFPVEVALKNGCKVIVHSRSSGLFDNRRLPGILHEFNKWRLQHMNVTRIAVSQMAGEWLFGKRGFAVYHNGVETEHFAYTQENRDAIRNETNCEGRTVIGSVAAFLPVKNHVFMVNAFEEYLKTNPNAVLWFVGDGPLKKEIEDIVNKKKLQDFIFFLGSRKDMQKLYAGMDMLWLPSTHEGYGNVLLEAQCEGVPCLLSDCIPQDARFLDNTFSCSLNETLENWALKIQEVVNAQYPDRVNCHKEMETLGASTKSEMKRIEALYFSLTSNS